MVPGSAGRVYDVLSVGRSCIDLYAHQLGVPLPEVKSFDAYVGGCPTNVSVGARRLGLRTALLTAVGDDPVGDFVLGFLRGEGVDTRFVPRKPGRRTSAALVSIDGPEEFHLTLYRAECADAALTIDDVRLAPVAESRIVFVTGTGLSRDPSRTATLFAAEEARRAAAAVVADLDYRPDQWDSPAAFGASVRALLRLSDVALGTEDEVRAASGCESAEDGAAVLAEGGPGVVVLKRGGRGCTVVRADGTRHDVAPFPATVVNVLGAGDAFASGLLYGWLQGWPLDRAARMGNAAGAIVVGRHGCANFMPTLPEVERFVAERGGL